MGDTPETPITQQAKEAITGRLSEVGQTVASSGVVEVISKASEDTKSMGDSWNTGYQKSQDGAEEKSQPQPSPSGVTGGRKRRRNLVKSRRKKSRKSRRSRRRKSKEKHVVVAKDVIENN